MLRQLIYTMLQNQVDGNNAERYLLATTVLPSTSATSSVEHQALALRLQMQWNTQYWLTEMFAIGSNLPPTAVHLFYIADLSPDPLGHYMSAFREFILPTVQMCDLPRSQ